MGDELTNNIEENAAGPKRAKGDAGEIEQHPLPDQIAADRYLQSKTAMQGKGLGIVTKKLVPPGTD
ncbi:MAG: hypothetical protein GC159_20960 [Phycisphaera sp.]|nr:hypothetical protein [Phycisphaera sp.]